MWNRRGAGRATGDNKGYGMGNGLLIVKRLGALLITTLLAGCLSPGTGGNGGSVVGVAEPPWVAVGIVDSGINPYHNVFQDPGAVLPPGVVDARTGLPPVPLQLSQEGTFDERVTADRAMWKSLEKGTLYWFRGTRVLGYSLLDNPGEDRFIGNTFHGTGVASVLRNLSREAWILVVQIRFDLVVAGEEDPLPAFLDAADGVAWLADQPWVDVVSLSIGAEGNPPLPELEAIAAATHRAVDAGKVVAVGAANLPSPTVQSGTNGPPWVISVGGAEGSTRGVSPQSGQIVDVVADYTRTVAGTEPDEYLTLHGTSLSTPVVAGAVAQALLELRVAADHDGGPTGDVRCPCLGRNITQGELRQALNATAAYFSTAEWAPLNYSNDPVMLAAFATAPVLPAPWVQMGWGYVGAETVPLLVAALRGEALPEKPAEASQYMATQQALREAYWNARDQ